MNVFSALLNELVDGLTPLIVASDDVSVRERLLAAIGTDGAAVAGAGLLPAMTSARDAIASVKGFVEAPLLRLATARDALETIRAALTALRAVQSSAPGSALSDLGRDLLELLAIRHVRLRRTAVHRFAALLGLIEPRLISGAIENGTRIRDWSLVDHLVVARISGMLTDPVGALHAQLPAAPLVTRAAADETADLAVARLGGLLSALGLPWTYGVRPEDAGWFGAAAPLARHILLVELPPALVGNARAGVCLALSPADEDDLGIVVTPFGGLNVQRTVGDWSVALGVGADIEGFAFGGGQGFQLLASPGTTDVRATFDATRSATGEPIVIGAAEGTRIELDGVRVYAEAALSTAKRVIDLGFEVESAVFVATSDGGDGFLGAAIGQRRLRATFDFGVSYTSERGLQFKGGAGLDVRIPASVTIGPLTLDEVAVAIEVSPDALRLIASCGIQVKLGPVAVRVGGVGTQMVAVLPNDSPPRDFDFDFAFRAPDGAGISIDTGPLHGGGYLRRDEAAGTYLGALALDVLGLKMSALGILDTRSPGGGYSLVGVISTEFTSVQLGLGFTLDGVGGLIGIHRRVDTDALRAALRGPGIAEIFFADDPVGQASRLTGDLARYFPGQHGRYVFGPAVKLGWGTPSIVTADLALLLEVPSPVRVVLLGTASAALPSQDHRIIDLNVDVVGEVDFSQKRVAIDASLRDSRVAGFPIVGDLALRMHWGDPPSFALAVGGFHSQFRVPPGFPPLRPIQIPIGTGDDPRLDIQGFLALTSNTAQVGAQANLYASAGPLNITGDLGFEALIIFSPFSFQVDVWAGVKLRRGNTVLAGVHFDGRLRGPWPWRLDGEASLSLWFVDLRVPVHFSFGSNRPVELPTRQIWPLLRPEVERAASWGTQLPAGVHAVATAPPPGEEATPHIDPGAMLTLRQRVVPLDRRITSFARGRPDGADEFRVTEVRVGGTVVPFTPVSDWFAPAQFEEMSEADKLSRPGFERMTAGVAVGGDVIRAGTALTKALEYETIVWADNQRQTAASYRPSRAEQVAGTAVSSVARAPLRTGGAATFAPPPATSPMFVLQEETYVIASTYDLQPRWDLTGAVTRGQAELALGAHLASVPGDTRKLQVVPSFEVAA